jgi:DNA-binding NarL/FixJ family response regulator
MTVRVLLVDDHKMMRDGLRLRLQLEKDFTVVGEATSAAEAYARIEETVPDVVIMDVNLPDETGIAATRKIHARLPALRLIVITSSFEPEMANEAILAGATGFLRKEDASDELVRAIRVAMEGKVYLSPDAATAVTAALREKQTSQGPALTEQELRVLKAVAEGLSHKEIAEAMSLSVKSIETYRARLTRKLGCSTRAELIRYAIRKGLVSA